MKRREKREERLHGRVGRVGRCMNSFTYHISIFAGKGFA